MINDLNAFGHNRNKSTVNSYNKVHTSGRFPERYEIFSQLCESLDTDTKNRLFTNPNKLMDFYYQENNFGFRDIKDYIPRTPGKKNLWIFGDSITWGDGIPLDCIWPKLLEGKLGSSYDNVYNMSVPGTGIDTAIRIAKAWLAQTSVHQSLPKTVITYGFYRTRIERITSNSKPSKSVPVPIPYYNCFDDVTEKQYQIKLDNYESLFSYYGVEHHYLDFHSEKFGWDNYGVLSDFGNDVREEFSDYFLNQTGGISKFFQKNRKSTFVRMARKFNGPIPHPGINSHKNIANVIFNEFFT